MRADSSSQSIIMIEQHSRPPTTNTPPLVSGECRDMFTLACSHSSRVGTSTSACQPARPRPPVSTACSTSSSQLLYTLHSKAVDVHHAGAQQHAYARLPELSCARRDMQPVHLERRQQIRKRLAAARACTRHQVLPFQCLLSKKIPCRLTRSRGSQRSATEACPGRRSCRPSTHRLAATTSPLHGGAGTRRSEDVHKTVSWDELQEALALGMAAACTGVGAANSRFATARKSRGSSPVFSQVAIVAGNGALHYATTFAALPVTCWLRRWGCSSARETRKGDQRVTEMTLR